MIPFVLGKRSMGFQPMHRGMSSESNERLVRPPAPPLPKTWAGSPFYLPTFAVFLFTFPTPARRFPA